MYNRKSKPILTAMWYLIVPPIVIVLAIVCLLWYLSRKAVDPGVTERARELEAAPGALSGIKDWLYRFLEKLAQRSKTGSLRMHNAFHAWLQSLRASRKRVSEGRTDASAPAAGALYESEILRAQTDESQEVFEDTFASRQERGDEKGEPLLRSESSLQMPIIRRRLRERREGEQAREPLETAPMAAPRRSVESIAPERAERPMVSEHVARPEAAPVRRRSPRTVSPEEGLIDQIAKNPKDFAAYEALGDYYMESGNVKDAKECYRQVLKLSPAHRMVKIKIRRLEKILSQKA